MSEKTSIPLSMVAVGEKVRLTNIHAGQKLRSRLAVMGMVPNSEFTVISNGRPGPFIVNVKGSRIALGRGMVQMVMVETLADGNQ